MTNAGLDGWADYGLAGLKLLIIVLLLAVLWVALDALTRFDDEQELFVRGNRAYGLMRASLVFAQTVALLPLLAGRTDQVWAEIRPVLGWGVGVLIVLVVLGALADRLLIRRRGVDSPAHVGMADAVLVSAFFVATGLIFNGALSGTAPDLATAVAATIVFGLVGLVGLVLAYLLLSASGLLYAGRRRAGSGNVSSALVSAGVLLAQGEILRTAIEGDFEGWGSAFVGFAVTFAGGFLALLVLLLLIDRLVIRSRTLKQVVAEDNYLAAAIMAVILVSIGLAIDAVAT